MSAPGTVGTLARIGSTALYAPGSGEPWVFLLWDGAAAPLSLPLADTWADQGAPRRPGWYVFLLAVPPAANAAVLEAALREALPAPTASGWAWSAHAKDTDALLRGAVSVKPDDEGRPVIAADAPVPFPPGELSFRFAAGLRVAATFGPGGEMDGLVATRPSVEGVPWTGIRIRLAGAEAGCIFFGALRRSAVAGDRSIKQEVVVQRDPLRPFERNRWSPTGRKYLLVHEGSGAYRLESYPSA